MLAALPAGWLADKYRRDFVLKGAAGLGTVAAATLAIALLYQLPVQSLFGACALLGIYTGFNNAPFEALFADCIQRGKRHAPSARVHELWHVAAQCIVAGDDLLLILH